MIIHHCSCELGYQCMWTCEQTKLKCSKTIEASMLGQCLVVQLKFDEICNRLPSFHV